MSEPRASLWHQTLLKYQGTSPEIDGQIKANLMGWEAEDELHTDGNTGQFYANAVVKELESAYHSPLMFRKVCKSPDILPSVEDIYQKLLPGLPVGALPFISNEFGQPKFTPLSEEEKLMDEYAQLSKYACR